ncbi:MAG: PAS domain-containing protein [Chlorobiales bacterium]|jgi:PAS domain-containing protein|nr:PAS domain-containing protein [Chlorobiales bacterium]
MQEKPFEQYAYLRAVVNAIPTPVFILDEDARILDANTAGTEYIGDMSLIIEKHFCGVVLRCVNTDESLNNCGKTVYCEDCVLRSANQGAAEGHKMVRKKGRMTVLDGDKIREIHYLVTVAPFMHEGRSLVLLTLEDITELVELQKIIPICSYCKKIRNDEQYWEKVDVYFQKNIGARFSHGICPDCVEKKRFLNKDHFCVE